MTIINDYADEMANRLVEEKDRRKEAHENGELIEHSDEGDDMSPRELAQEYSARHKKKRGHVAGLR